MADQSWTLGTLPASDGYTLRFRKYESANPKGPVIAFNHGIQSHGGWYDRGCRYFADAGFTNYFFDRRGSGLNESDRGHARSHFQLMDDLRASLAMVRREHPGSPLILAAISWGGKLAVATLADHPQLADGLILVAPGFVPQVHPPLGDQLRIALAGPFRPRRKLPVPLSDPALFTPHPEGQELIAQDPVSIREASARLLFCSRLLDFRLRRVAKRITHPTLLVLASMDRIIHNAQTRAFVGGFASKDVEIVELEGGHTLEFEPDPTPYYETLRRWIDRQFSGGKR